MGGGDIHIEDVYELSSPVYRGRAVAECLCKARNFFYLLLLSSQEIASSQGAAYSQNKMSDSRFTDLSLIRMCKAYEY